MKLLVAEDDEVLQQVIGESLAQEGYETDRVNNGNDALWFAENGTYDVILLDIMMPGLTGITVIENIRRAGCRTPILLVTAKDSITDRVRGLDAGADDYLVKPFAVSELLARVRALLRRRAGYAHDVTQLECGKLVLRGDTNEAYVESIPLNLRGKEYGVLEFLVQNKGRIVTRDQIFTRVWGFDSDVGESIVDVYIHYIRKKLTQVNCESYLSTKRGIGFLLQDPTT